MWFLLNAQLVERNFFERNFETDPTLQAKYTYLKNFSTDRKPTLSVYATPKYWIFSLFLIDNPYEVAGSRTIGFFSLILKKPSSQSLGKKPTNIDNVLFYSTHYFIILKLYLT